MILTTLSGSLTPLGEEKFCLALLVAFGGTSYATVLNVPRNCVGTPQLRRNSVALLELVLLDPQIAREFAIVAA